MLELLHFTESFLTLNGTDFTRHIKKKFTKVKSGLMKRLDLEINLSKNKNNNEDIFITGKTKEYFIVWSIFSVLIRLKELIKFQ